MTQQEAIDKLKALEGYDKERDHCEADDILCELLSSLGYGEVVDQFNKLEKWYA